jgi:hypothetical protein
MIGLTKRRVRARRSKVVATFAVVAMVGGLLGFGMANATLTGAVFEGHDGNIVANGGVDWANLVTSGGTLNLGTDQQSGQNDNSFTQGSKEDDVDVQIGLGSIPNNKADIGKFAVGSQTIASGSRAGNVQMYLAWVRNNDGGTTNFDFEINQAAQPDMTIAPGSPNRSVHLNRTGDGAGPLVDDLLIAYDLQGGASTPTLSFRRWGGSAWGAPTTITSANSEGKINCVSTGTTGTCPNGAGAISQADSGPFNQAIAATRFGEAAIDLSALGIIPNQNDPNAPCVGFGSAYVKSRASSSFTSQMKDYSAPIPVGLNSCGTIIIQKVTDPSPDTTDTSFPFTLTGGASALNKSFSLKNGGSNTTLAVKAGSGYVAAEQTPTGWDLTSATCDDGSPVTNIAVSTGETVTCTFTNTGRADLHIVKDAERGGVDFDFTADSPLSPATFSLQDGDTQDFLNLAPGTYGVAELVPEGWDLDSATCDNGDEPDEVTLGAGDDVTCTFVNSVERGALLIHKSAKHAAAANGTINQSGVTFDVTNANGTDETVVTDANGNACVPDVPVSFLDGPYTATETVPTGYHAQDAEQTGTVVEDTTCATATAVEFVNIPLTNVTVSVDSQIAGGTASVIDCDGDTASTGANGDGSLTVTDLEPTDPAVTLTCTIVVDP